MKINLLISRHLPTRYQFIPAGLLIAAVIVVVAAGCPAQAPAPVIDRSRGREMLQNIKAALKDEYYDSNFQGVNIDAKFKEAEKQINESTSTWRINAIIAEVLMELDDSHTFFFAPDLVVGVTYDFDMRMIGDTCYVVKVKADSGAAKKGLKVGDVIYSILGLKPTRENLWKINYSLDLLPTPILAVVVQAPDGGRTQLMLDAVVSNKKRKKVIVPENEHSEKPPTFYDLGDETILCKLPAFDLSDKEVDDLIKRIRTRNVLILDLRGNPGGYDKTARRLIGYFFDQDVRIGNEKERKSTTPSVAKTRGREKSFTGKVFVLVDSESASAAEVFARVMQLQKRGTVIGDQSAGAVMGAVHRGFAFMTAADPQARPSAFYGVSITVTDLIMADGESLEKKGVKPDNLIRPSASDLAAKRDPVLSFAAKLAGVELAPEKAGAIFPPEPENDESKEKKKKN